MNLSLQKVVAGGGLVLATSVLLPILKSISRPALHGATMGSGAMLQGVAQGVVLVKEEIEDLIAEAQFERLKRQIDSELQ